MGGGIPAGEGGERGGGKTSLMTALKGRLVEASGGGGVARGGVLAGLERRPIILRLTAGGIHGRVPPTGMTDVRRVGKGKHEKTVFDVFVGGFCGSPGGGNRFRDG